MAESYKISAKGISDVGRVRPTNQDAFLVDDKNNRYIVADGMGGHAGGEIASKLCIEHVINYLEEHTITLEQKIKNGKLEKFMSEILSNSINNASSKIYEYALEEPALRGMGTTATVLVVIDNTAFCAHVGDSRMYLNRSGFLYQLTFDHSLVHEQVRAGLLSPEEAELHHLKNVITRSVGYQEEEDVDTFALELEKDDLLLICSDGLHGKVSDIEISNYTKKYGITAVNQLVALANDRGGDDNISIVIINIQA